MYRVPRGTFNPQYDGPGTDAWDTIDWLVKNVTRTTARSACGASYPGLADARGTARSASRARRGRAVDPVVDVWKATTGSLGRLRPAYAFDFIYSMETRRQYAATPTRARHDPTMLLG